METESYLTTVFRYILQNPMKAGLEKHPGEKYRWTNVGVYHGYDDGLTDWKFLSEYFNSRKELILYLNKFDKDDEHKINIMSGERINDDTAKYLLKILCAEAGIDDFYDSDAEKKAEVVCKLYNKYRLPIRQISRITGVGFRVVKKYATEGDGPVALHDTDDAAGDGPVALHDTDDAAGDGPNALH